MIIWLVLLAPGIFAALYFEYIMKLKSSIKKQAAIWLCFSFFINFFVVAAIWLRGYDSISFWSLDVNSPTFSVPFAVKYMAFSAVWAILLPWVAALFSTFAIKRESLEKHVDDLIVTRKMNKNRRERKK